MRRGGPGSLRLMAGEVIYAFRVMRLPLLDAGGSEIGKIADIVVVPGRPGHAPRVVGYVASSQRRRIFVNAGKVAALDSDGVRLRSWDLDLHPFKRREGETLVSELIDRAVRGETVSDVGLTEVDDGRTSRWEVSKIRLARRSALRRRSNFRLVDWRDLPELWVASSEAAAEAARLRDMHPSDVAHVVRVLPLSQRRQLAQAMDDERLADLLEELPEEEQLRLIEDLDLDRLLDVLDEMEYDDLADLLNEMPTQQRTAILEAMDEEEAEVLSRLLSYEEGTAGSMLTPEVIIMGPDDTVAEALARIRDPDWTPSIAGQVYVCRPPLRPPTGRYLGVVFVQRLLREPPGIELSRCLREVATVRHDTPEREVFEEFASYDMLALPVVDEVGRFLGAVSVDDVVDRMLGSGWRQRARRRRDASTAISATGSG
jgi:CBS domain-containing protein